MAAKTDPLLGLKYGWTLGEDNWNTGMDANLLTIAALLQLVITDYTATPPASPATGSRYLVAASPTGAWAGKAQNVAVWDGTTWTFYVPKNGWMAFSYATGTPWRYTGSVWINTFAVTADMQAATSASLVATPAGVREFLEALGFGATFMNTAADLNALNGTSDKTVPFNFGSGTANRPVTGSFGRGLQFASGGNYTTQIAWINGSIDSYIRFNNGGTWTAWTKQAFNANDLTSTAWIAATLLNGWSVNTGSRAVYRKVLGLVFVDIDIQPGTTTEGTSVLSLPAGYRPVRNLIVPVFAASVNAQLPAVLVIRSDGDCRVSNVNAGSGITLTFSFSVQ